MREGWGGVTELIGQRFPRLLSALVPKGHKHLRPFPFLPGSLGVFLKAAVKVGYGGRPNCALFWEEQAQAQRSRIEKHFFVVGIVGTVW